MLLNKILTKCKNLLPMQFSTISILLVVSIILLTCNITSSVALDIEQNEVPTLISVEGPSELKKSDETITVSQEDLEQTDYAEFGNIIIDDAKIIFNSIVVTVKVYGKTHEIETAGGTVRDAVDKCFELKEGDLVNYDLAAPLVDGMSIEVTDIEYKNKVEQEEIGFSTDVVYSDEYYSGQIYEQAGQKGLKEYTYRHKYVDNKLVDSKLLKEEVVKQPVNAKTIVGTRNASKTYMTSGINYVSSLTPSQDFMLDDNYRPVNYTKIMTGTASAYSSDPYTATGKKCRTGYVAVNPSIIPYHTKMYIVCSDNSYFYGYASAEDTGGFIHWGTRIVDLYFNTEAECERFGLRNVQMYLFN